MKFVLRTSEVKFAHFAEGKLHYPQDNFTYEVNFTCPEGKLSLACLLYRRYAKQPFFGGFLKIILKNGKNRVIITRIKYGSRSYGI